MARIKLSLPTNNSFFQCEIPLRITDLNYGAHMGNQVILELCHEARMRYLQMQGHDEKNFLGSGLIMADAAIVYKAEGLWPDTLSFELYADEFNSYGFDFFYWVKNTQGKEVARAKTGMVFYDYDHKKMTRAPEELKSFFNQNL